MPRSGVYCSIIIIVDVDVVITIIIFLLLIFTLMITLIGVKYYDLLTRKCSSSYVRIVIYDWYTYYT